MKKLTTISCCVLLEVALHLNCFSVGTAACQNDDTFFYKDPILTCKYIRWLEERRQQYCQYPEVHNYCPQACGICCEDNATFQFHLSANSTDAPKDCAWLSNQNNERKEKLCKKHREGYLIGDQCVVSCNFCKEPISVAPSTTNPNASPSPSISSYPTVTCEDNYDVFTYNTTNSISCRWVRRNNNRRTHWCKASIVQSNCPFTCGTCCRDNPSYTFTTDNSEEGNCEWVGETAFRISHFCDRLMNGSIVRNACPQSCNNCKEYISVAPSETLSSTPSLVPSVPPSITPPNGAIRIFSESVIRQRIPSGLFGVNIVYSWERDQFWAKKEMHDSLSYIENALVRYPGGEVTSYFHWENPNGHGWVDSWKNSKKPKEPDQWMSVNEYFANLKKLKGTGMVGLNLHSGWELGRVPDGLDETEGLAAKAFNDGINIKYWFFDNEQYADQVQWDIDTYCNLANRHGKRVIKFFPDAKFVINWHFDMLEWEEIVEKCKYVDVMDVHFYWHQYGWGTSSWNSYVKSDSPILTYGLYKTPIEDIVKRLKLVGHTYGKNMEVGFHEWGVGPADDEAAIMTPFQYAFVNANVFMHMIESEIDHACYWPLRQNTNKPLNAQDGNRALFDADNKPTVVNMFLDMFKDIKEYKLVESDSSLRKILTITGLSQDKKQMIVYMLRKDHTGADIVILDRPYPQFIPVSATATSYYAPKGNTMVNEANISYPPAEITSSGKVELRIPAWSLTRVVMERSKEYSVKDKK